MILKRNLAKGTLLSFFATALLINKKAEAQAIVPERVPASMGLMGDSISAGMLAAYKRQTVTMPWNLLTLAIRGAFVAGTQDISKVETRGYSWGAGQARNMKVASHALRLEAISGKKLKAINVAVSGEEVDGVLNRQVQDLNNQSRSELNREFPEYVVLLIGANDICAANPKEMTSIRDYHAKMNEIAGRVLEKSPDTKLLISSLPNIATLQDVARDERTLAMTCGQLWQQVKICDTLMNLTDEGEKAEVAQRVRDYNLAVQDIVERAQEDYGDRVRFANQVYDVPFNANDLAPDCFHPNPNGQNKLADVSFKSSWWANQWEEKGKKNFDKKLKDMKKKQQANLGHPARK